MVNGATGRSTPAPPLSRLRGRGEDMKPASMQDAVTKPRTAASQAPLIRVKDVSLTYVSGKTQVQALQSVSFDVRENEFLSILGPSGCGKSTLLKAIADLLPVSSGHVLVDGKPPEVARKSCQVGFLFQDGVLLPWKTVMENVTFLSGIAGRGRDQRQAQELINLVGLTGFERAMPHELSGGMQQRVSIARALMLNPLLLLMDEPFGALDEITREKMNLELLRIWSERRKTVIFITHSIAEAVFLSDRVAVMSARPGRIQAVFDINLPRPRTSTMRYGPEAADLVRELHASLHQAENTAADRPRGA
jgi:NitT/TauT family transport system ATP-binding protein